MNQTALNAVFAQRETEVMMIHNTIALTWSHPDRDLVLFSLVPCELGLSGCPPDVACNSKDLP